MSHTNSNEPSASKMIAGVCSFFFPGLGQLFLGRIGSAIKYFIYAIIGWSISFYIISDALRSKEQAIIILGFLIALIPNLLSAYDATNSDFRRLNTEKEKHTPNTDFQDYDEYAAWCKENGQDALTYDEFRHALRK